MIAAAPVALAAWSPIAVVAPIDPIAAAYDELVTATLELERAHDATGDLGGALLAWVRSCVRLNGRLRAEHGEDDGGAIWTAAMDRHYAWHRARYSLLDDA